jgi:hypothetical protein
MEDNDFYTMLSGGHEILTHMYDHIHENDEEWIDSILGDEDELIRQLTV